MTDPYDRTAMSDTVTGGDTPTDEAYCSACNQSYPLDHDVCPKDGARLIKLRGARDALIGRILDQRYEVRGALGEGGMGTVYRAHQLSVDREVALKVIHSKLASNRTAVKRFLREARLASRLSQPNVVNVYDFGQTEDGVLYLVMELLRGNTLARELEPMRPLPLRRVLAIGLQLCDALEVAHAQGIIHRDLKPGNIIVLDDPPGRDLIKVLDFGLAKSLATETSSLITASSALLGTPLYMPPEQIGGESSDQRGDLYALGCILHHMLAGRPPFVRETVNAVLAAHLHEPPPPLVAPAPLAELVAGLMAKSPNDRPSSAARVREVLQAAGDLADTIPVPDVVRPEPVASPPPAKASSRRNLGLVLAAAVVALAAGAGVLALRHDAVDAPAKLAAPGDAARPTPIIAIDAAASVETAQPDAAVVPHDAGVHPTHHAQHVPPHVSVDAGVTAPPPPRPADAGMPSIDFAK